MRRGWGYDHVVAAVERIDRDDRLGERWTTVARCQGCGATRIRSFTDVADERADALSFAAAHEGC